MTVIDEDLFNLIRQEQKEHTESYSMLLHEIEDVQIIRRIVNAESYEAFTNESA